MAQVEDNNSSGRQIAVELNIVPFIDLMSVLIIFLLITAVWTQVSMLQLGSSIYGKKQSAQEPLKVPPRAEVPFRVDVKSYGYQITIGSKKNRIDKKQGKYDRAAFLSALEGISNKYKDKKDVVLTMQDDLEYEALILAMDGLLVSGFPEISIAAVEGE